MNKSKALKKGDTIGIAAPASPFDKNLFMHGVHALEKMGFKTFYQRDIFDQDRYLAGDDSRRANELMEMFKSRNINAIMFARGGYGSQRIIPLLDSSVILKHRKPVIGFSDLTALLTFLNQKCSAPVFYGPVMTQLGQKNMDFTQQHLFKALTTCLPLGEMPIGNAKILREGSSKGKLTGGCIALINSSIGTPYELDTKGSILLLEDIGEKVYVLDRMLTQLKNSGKLDDVRGIIFGSLIPPEGEKHSLDEMIEDVLSGFMGPVIMDFPAGHCSDFVTLPLGVSVEIKASQDSPPVVNIFEEALC